MWGVNARPPVPVTRRIVAGLVALCLGAGLAGLAGCGDDSEPAGATTPSVSTTTGSDGQATTATIPTTSTAITTLPTTSAPVPVTPTTTTDDGADGGIAPGKTSTNDGGVEPIEPGDPADPATPPTSTGDATTPAHQDPGCKPGTGPGFPERPQCEPAEGPDARDEG
jgi:hypothetical protein